MLYQKTTNCRMCSSDQLEPMFDLGYPCISDFPADPDKHEDRAPLCLAICNNCGLVQLTVTVCRDRLYRNYYYKSGTNETMIAALRDIVDQALTLVELKPDDLVLDIGANDGTLLSMYPRHVWAHGYDPAKNLTLEAVRNAHARIFPTFFPPDQPTLWKYKIITSIAMFYDVDNVNEFVASIKDCLHDDGIWIIQLQDLHNMLAQRGFDNICHEHLTYWSQATFQTLLARHNLHIAHASINTTNGGSVRYVVKHGSSPRPVITKEQVYSYKHQLRVFATTINRIKQDTLELLETINTDHKLIMGYGASTKGNTLLQYFNITTSHIPFIADRNPDKWGLHTAGTHIPIISEEIMREANADYLFILPWHFIDAFQQREANFLTHGKMIVPLPNLTILGGTPCQSTLVGFCARA